MRVKRVRSGGAEVRLDAVEARILLDLVAQVGQLLAEEPVPDEDPLEAMVGIRDRDRPVDPALLRLLPDTYRDDPAASDEVRRLAESDVRRAKADAARVLRDTVPAQGGRVSLGEDEVDGWLRALTDVRLALASRLGVDTDPELAEEDLDRDDPRAPHLAVYGWLGELQERLVRAVMPD